MKEILLVLFALYGLSTCGRLKHPGKDQLKGWNYAHRGLHSKEKGIPENSLAAFRAAVEHGYGAELDVHLLKDGNLAVIHDSLLERVTGAQGRIEDLTTEELKNYRLEGTEETIPTFREVLDVFAGKTPLVIELKPVNGNHAALCKTACEAMEGYEGIWCMESFDPRCVYWLKKNRPQIIRGQLSENFVRTDKTLPFWTRFMLTHNLSHFVTSPDFIAYRFDHRKQTFSNYLCRKVWGMMSVSWTLQTREDYDTAVAEGWIPIFENFEP